MQDKQPWRSEGNFCYKLEKQTGIPYFASVTVWRDCSSNNKFVNFRDSVLDLTAEDNNFLFCYSDTCQWRISWFIYFPLNNLPQPSQAPFPSLTEFLILYISSLIF